MRNRTLAYARRMVLSITISIACLVFATIYFRHGLGPDAYVLPLVGDIAVYRDSLAEPIPLAAWGPLQLVRVEDPRSSALLLFVPHLQRVAVVNSFIVGETAQGFFVMDSSEPQSANDPRIVSREAWQRALVAAGLPPEVRLSEPDALAARLPNRVLRRSQMRVMQGALSLTDQEWEGVLILGSWLSLFLFGTCTAKRFLTPVGVVTGFFTIGFARLFLGDGGPDLLAGAGDPFVCVGVAHLGRLLANKGRAVRANGRVARPVSRADPL